MLLVSAAVGVAVASMTHNPYLGILAAILAGGLMNLVFGYLVITRKANQLASGLATMFFGFGLSALIGKDVVGAKIAVAAQAAATRPCRPAARLLLPVQI